MMRVVRTPCLTIATALAFTLRSPGSTGETPPRILDAISRAPSGALSKPEPVDDALRAHAEDVADYTLRATLDPRAHVVHGAGSIHWRNASTQPVRELWLHLYLNAFKSDRSAFMRERVGGRGSTVPQDWGSIDLRRLALHDADGATTDLLRALEPKRRGDDDETDARVPLPREVAPGESVDLDVAFDDKLPSIVERTGYRGTFHMVGQWFPKVARLEPNGTWMHFPFHHLSEFYADFGTYDVTLDVPAGYTIGATGPAVERREERGRLVERHVQADVHDFAWTAWDQWQTSRETIDGVEVTVLFPRGFAGIAARDLAAVRFALPYDAALYGRYPYRVLTVVHPEEDASEAGGMEYPTLITSEGPWLTPPGVWVPEIVAVHELAHQWFYGLIATNEAAWPFLDEGLTQFAEVDAMARWHGKGSAADVSGLRLSDAAIQAVSGNRAVHDERVAQPADAFTSGANYARLVYGRTAALLATLAGVYGEYAVERALGRYARRFRFEHPGPEDLLGVFEDGLGRPAAAALRAGLFEKGWVDYAVDEVSSEHRQAAWEGSVLVRRRGTLSFPVDVELVMTDGSTRRERWDGVDESTRIPWHGPVALRAAVVDPDDRVLVDQNLENNHRAADGLDGEGAPRTLERMTYWTQLVLQAISP
jgi:hypothetical protein